VALACGARGNAGWKVCTVSQMQQVLCKTTMALFAAMHGGCRQAGLCNGSFCGEMTETEALLFPLSLPAPRREGACIAGGVSAPCAHPCMANHRHAHHAPSSNVPQFIRVHPTAWCVVGRVVWQLPDERAVWQL
jgi:hypothetical protein